MTPPSAAEGVELIAAAIGEADAAFGYSFNMTRLVDGIATHTLVMDGFEPVDFDDREDGYALIGERRNRLRADAIIAAWNTRAIASQAPPAGEVSGYIVGSADGSCWRTWAYGSPSWTGAREAATRYARREDAENVHREDEGAWRIEPYAALSPPIQEAVAGKLPDRETIGKIIDRTAFGDAYIGNRAFLNGSGIYDRRRERRDAALAKADAILSAIRSTTERGGAE